MNSHNTPSITYNMEFLKKALLVLVFIIAAIIGLAMVGNDHSPPPITEDNTLELSLGGEVKYYSFPQGSTIHVITDEHQNLTDIQVFTTVKEKNYLITPTNTKWQTNKHEN